MDYIGRTKTVQVFKITDTRGRSTVVVSEDQVPAEEIARAELALGVYRDDDIASVELVADEAFVDMDLFEYE